MPSCRECSFLKNNTCTAHTVAQAHFDRPIPPAPMGACPVAIVQSYCQVINSNHKVLEIGCGTWSPLKDHCKKVGAQYEGIDVQDSYYGKPVVATRIENLSELSFVDNTFDFVIGNQTMEHWAQYGCSNIWGLYQCFRVCKMGGFVFLNFPIHYHGTKNFVMGDLDQIQDDFLNFSKNVTLEKWGTPSDPIQSWSVYPDFSPLADKHAYHLSVKAQKNIETIRPPLGNVMAFTGVIGRMLNNDFFFSLYRIKKRLKGEPVGIGEPPK